MLRYFITFLAELSEKINKFIAATLSRLSGKNNYSQGEESQRINKLEEIYSRIPEISCVEDCGKCCGLISMSELEDRRVRRFLEENHLEVQFYNDPLDVTYVKALRGENRCYFLDERRRCLVYPVRPIICRLYGVAENMKCPYASPGEYLTEGEALNLIREVKKI